MGARSKSTNIFPALFLILILFFYFVSLFRLSFFLASLVNRTGKMKVTLIFVMAATIMMATRFQPGDSHVISSQQAKSESDIPVALLLKRRENFGLNPKRQNWISLRREEKDYKPKEERREERGNAKMKRQDWILDVPPRERECGSFALSPAYCRDGQRSGREYQRS